MVECEAATRRRSKGSKRLQLPPATCCSRSGSVAEDWGSLELRRGPDAAPPLARAGVDLEGSQSSSPPSSSSLSSSSSSSSLLAAASALSSSTPITTSSSSLSMMTTLSEAPPYLRATAMARRGEDHGKREMVASSNHLAAALGEAKERALRGNAAPEVMLT